MEGTFPHIPRHYPYTRSPGVWRGTPEVGFRTDRGKHVASSRDRQRKLARAKLDRQLARRAARLRRRRRIQAGIGAALAVLLIVLGGVWLAGGFDRDKADPT